MEIKSGLLHKKRILKCSKNLLQCYNELNVLNSSILLKIEIFCEKLSYL